MQVWEKEDVRQYTQMVACHAGHRNIGDIIGISSYLVDPASSHMLV